jgi:hypothetical protein
MAFAFYKDEEVHFVFICSDFDDAWERLAGALCWSPFDEDLEEYEAVEIDDGDRIQGGDRVPRYWSDLETYDFSDYTKTERDVYGPGEGEDEEEEAEAA